MKFHYPHPRFPQVLLIFFISIIVNQTTFSQCNGSLQLTVQTINPCANDGQMSVNVSNGTPPYTYEWVNYIDPAFSPTTQTVQNVRPGYYGVTVRDAAGNCGSKQEIYLPSPFNFQVTTTPEQCPNQDGSAEVIDISGGTLPYSFIWSTGATTQKITQIPAGSYLVTVIDGNGCFSEYGYGSSQDSTSIMVEQLNDIKINISTTSATCSLNSGAATVSVVSGGTAPFTYEWKDYQNNLTWNTATIQNVLGNTYYEVKVTDDEGCFVQSFQYIRKEPSFTLSTTSTQENCYKADGTATVVANGGTGPYTYLWNNGNTTKTNTSLTAGSYSVTVTDANGCQETRSTYVQSYSPIQIDYTLVHEICTGQNGEIEANPTQGNPPYTYAWSNGASTKKITGLSAGFYIVTVADTEGCQSLKYISLADNPSFNVSMTMTNETCQGAKGTASVTVTGGVLPYSYIWSNGETTPQVSNLDAGYYTCTISDGSGCSTVRGVNIVSTVQIYAYLSVVPESCTQANGSLWVNANGSNQPYTYTWNTGATTANITQLSSGYYTVTITDTKGCTLVKSQYLNRNSGNLKASILTTPASCIYNEDGQAEAVVTGGTPPYEYQWGNGGQTPSISGLKAYFGMGLVVKDALGCLDHTYVPTIGFTNTDCAGIIRGQVLLDANQNCTLDGGDMGLENVMVSCVPSPQGLAFTNATGHYQYYVPKNTEHALTQQHGFLFPICPTSSLIVPTLNSGELSDQNNFYNDPAQIEDLSISMGYSIPPRPGFPFELEVRIDNKGLFKASGQATISYNQFANYMGGGTNHDPSLKEIYLTFQDLAAFTGTQKFILRFETPANVSLGTIQKYEAKVVPVLSDVTKHNNQETIRVAVVGSYDPNDKAATLPNGLKSDCLTKQDSILKYTIRFQNTGNFPASFVIIKDTLHPNLDYTTLRGGVSSHPYKMQFLPDGYLHFIFDPIFLPDSTLDEANSHGYVTYYISPKKSIAEDDWIYNTAAIYFDFNEPIITNTTSLITCRTSATKPTEVLSKLSIQPNPSTDFTQVAIENDSRIDGQLELFNMLGQKVKTWKIQSPENQVNITLEWTNLPLGQYTLRYSGVDGSVSKMLVKQ